MLCKNCGNPLEEGAKFCAVCGTVVEEAPVDANGATVEPAPSDPGKVFGIISMVVAIVGILLSTVCTCCTGCFGVAPAVICGIAALVLGILGKKKSAEAGFKNTFALVGMIIGIVVLALGVLAAIGWLIYTILVGGVSLFGSMMEY